MAPERLACPLPHLLQPLLLRCRRAISSADPLDFAASALRSSIRATPRRALGRDGRCRSRCGVGPQLFIPAGTTCSCWPRAPRPLPRFRVTLSPLAPEIVPFWGSGEACFGRDDRYSGFLSSRRPGWPAWSTSSATIAALRGSEGRLLGGSRGVLPPPSPLPPGASSSLLRPSERLRLQIQNPSESGINVSHEFSGNLSNPGGEIGCVEGHDLSDVGDGVLREPGACR